MIIFDQQSINLVLFTQAVIDNYESFKSVAVDIGAMIKWAAVTGAAMTAIYVGLRGLKSWEEQLHGTSAYSVSVEVLKAGWTLFNGINSTQKRPLLDIEVFRYSSDMPMGLLQYYDKKSQAIARRLERVSDGQKKLDDVIPAMAAVVSPDLQQRAAKLLAISNEMFLSLEQINNMLRSAHSSFQPLESDQPLDSGTKSHVTKERMKFKKDIEELFESIVGPKADPLTRRGSEALTDLILGLLPHVGKPLADKYVGLVEARKADANNEKQQADEPEGDSKAKKS